MSGDVFLDFFYLFLTKKALFFIALNNFVSCLLMDSVNFHEQPFNFQAVILQLVHIVLMIQAQLINLFFVFILLQDDVCLLLLQSLLAAFQVLHVYLDFGVLLAKVLGECIDLVALVVHLELFDLQLQVPLVYLLLHLVQLLLLQEDFEGLRIRQVHLVNDRCVCRRCRLLLRRLRLLLLLRG